MQVQHLVVPLFCFLFCWVAMSLSKGGGGGRSSGGGRRTLMTREAASRIQSAEARRSGGTVKSGGFAARAQVRPG
jgi:hypothetical protein